MRSIHPALTAQLAAFTISEKPREQERVWRELPEWARNQRSGQAIREHLTERHIDASTSALAKFVGVEAYAAAGGGITKDLFANPDEPGYFTNAKLLTRLADEKLKALAESIKAEGWKWVQISPQWDWQDEQKMTRVSATISPEQRAEIDALEAKQQKIIDEQSDEDQQLTAEGETAYMAIEQQIDDIKADAGFTLAQKALAGVVVTIGSDGNAEIKRGLVKPEDARAAKKLEPKAVKANGAIKDEQQEKPEFSVALTQSLTEHRTQGVQAKLATNPKVALVAVVHALVLSLLHPEQRTASILHINAHGPQISEDLGKTPAAKEFAAATREATKGMPKDGGKLWDWLLQQNQARLLSILAVCAAHSADAVEKKFNGADRAAANRLAQALKLDMATYFQASADNFFSRVSKAQVLEAVAAAAGAEKAEALSAMKKEELIVAAEKAVRGKGFLPSVLANG